MIMYQRQINLRNLNAAFRLSGSASNNDDYDNEMIFPLNHSNITTQTHTRKYTHRCKLCVHNFYEWNLQCGISWGREQAQRWGQATST